jgi:hypothetical protein
MQGDYEKMTLQEKIEKVYDLFETSFIYKDEELILHKKWNIYFRLFTPDDSRMITPDEFDYKLLSYLSFYTANHHFNKKRHNINMHITD